MANHSLKIDRDDILKCIIYPLPVWWLLGVEQLIIFSFGILSFFYFLSEKKLDVKQHESLLLLFLASTFLSIFFVYEPSRLLEIFRSTIAFITLIFGSWFIGQLIAEKGEKNVLKYIYILFLWCIFSALISFFLTNFTWIAPIEKIIPGALKEFHLVRDLYYKRLGDHYFSLFGPFWRPRGFFSYSTALAFSVALLIPVIHYYKKYTRSTAWISVTIWLGVLVVIATTTRITLIAVIIVYIFFSLFVYKNYRKYILYSSPIIILSLFYIFETINLVDIFYVFMEIRGAGSANFRINLYYTALEYYSERPFFGWGAQVPHDDFYAALGSHSGYLNILFCYGIIGFLLFYTGILNCILHIKFSSKKGLVLLGSWIVFFIVSFTEVFHLDFITVLVLTFIIALTAYRPFENKLGNSKEMIGF